jgi:hypothetical protein
MGAYPVRIDPKNESHKRIKRHFKNMIMSLAYTMPCSFCRESFQGFSIELPIDSFMTGRIKLVYWLYLIKDKVNKKLMNQEKHCYNNEKKLLKKSVREGTLSEQNYYTQLDAFKSDTFITQPSPTFKNVLEKYESIRAVCSKHAKTCALPKKKE